MAAPRSIAQSLHHLHMPPRRLKHARCLVGHHTVFVVFPATHGRVLSFTVNPIPVPDNRANVAQSFCGGTELAGCAFDSIVGIDDACGGFPNRLGGAHKCHAGRISLHTAPLEEAGAAKTKRHDTAPSVTFARLSSASAYRQGVSGR